jgi:hypothetical protein
VAADQKRKDGASGRHAVIQVLTSVINFWIIIKEKPGGQLVASKRTQNSRR